MDGPCQKSFSLQYSAVITLKHGFTLHFVSHVWKIEPTKGDFVVQWMKPVSQRVNQITDHIVPECGLH